MRMVGNGTVDPKHDWVSSRTAFNGGRNDGFLLPNAGPHQNEVLSYFTDDRLPFMHALAREFTVCDRWFSSVMGPTWPNRFYLHAATADGVDPDPNRNCFINAKGLSKGGFPVPVSTGKANAWGLVNAVGNVRELTVDGGQTVAAGGDFNDPLDRCVAATRADAGDGDDETGLRIARDLASP